MRYFVLAIALLLFVLSGLSEGAGKKVSEIGNKHNFSYMNISVNFRALQQDVSGLNRTSQICIYCHIPHRSSTEGPLWNRKATTVPFFKRYSSVSLAIDNISQSQYGQPNGSSRLCLSCHDGVTALGAVFAPAWGPVAIPFTNSKGWSGPTVNIGYETYSSHHPVSFIYDVNVVPAINTAHGSNEYSLPTHAAVKLDNMKRMQCTTCHDPHQSKSNDGTPFWVANTHDEVCLTCHNVVRSQW